MCKKIQTLKYQLVLQFSFKFRQYNQFMFNKSVFDHFLSLLLPPIQKHLATANWKFMSDFLQINHMQSVNIFGRKNVRMCQIN